MVKSAKVRTLAWLVGLLVARALAAQPIAVFELDDYLDPRTLGSVPTAEGSFESGRRFVLVESVLGAVNDFEFEGATTDGRTQFAHAALRTYSGKHQWNLLVTGFDPPEQYSTGAGAPGRSGSLLRERGRRIPDYRIRLQYGRYGVSSTPQSDVGFVSRALWTVGYENGPAGAVTELGLVLDFPLDFLKEDPSNPKLIGSLGYQWRIVEDGYDLHRILYHYSWKNQHWRHWATPVRLSYGAERSEGEWRKAPLRLEAGIQIPIERLNSTLYITYAPSYRYPSRGFDGGWNHELAVFVNPVFFTRILRPGKNR